MSLEDYILEDEQVLSTLSFGLTKVVATNLRVIRYEAGSEKEAFLDLPYEKIVSIETTFERISHHGMAMAGGILLAIDLAVWTSRASWVVPSWLYAIWAIGSFALIGLGFLKETRLSLRFLGEGIPEREKQWEFPVGALYGKHGTEYTKVVSALYGKHEKPENLPEFTKVVRKQLSE